MQEIRIQLQVGKFSTVRGYYVPHTKKTLAVNGERGAWTVTHVATGLACGGLIPTKALADRLARRFYASIQSDPEAIPGLTTENVKRAGKLLSRHARELVFDIVPPIDELDNDPIVRAMRRDDCTGICKTCGEEISGCEPDARERMCPVCETPTVYGAEELVMMGAVS